MTARHQLSRRRTCYHCGHRIRITRDNTYRRHRFFSYGRVYKCPASGEAPRVPVWEAS